MPRAMLRHAIVSALVLVGLVACRDVRTPMMQGDGNNGAAPATAPQVSGADPGKASLTSAPSNGECTTDMDCTLGAKCLRASGGTHGYCGRKVDSMGMPSMSPGRQVSGCMSNMDCPLGFHCVGDGFSKVCAR